MKKLFIFLSLIVATTTMRSQTFYGTGVYLNADPLGAVFDLSNPDLYDGFVLKVKDASGNVVVDLGAILQSVMSGSTGTYTVPYVSYHGIDCSPLTSYSFTYQTQYYVDYYFPSTWQFDYYTHNPYTTIGINLYLYDEDDRYMGLYKIGTPEYAHTMYSTYWHCYGIGTGLSYISQFRKFYINPTNTDYEDAYYDDYQAGYLSKIDHVKLNISFRGN